MTILLQEMRRSICISQWAKALASSYCSILSLLFFRFTAIAAPTKSNQFNPSSVNVSSTPVRSLSVPSFNSKHTMAPAPQHPKQGVSSTGGNFPCPCNLCIMSLPFAPSSCASHKWPVQTRILDTDSDASLMKRDVA